MSEFEKVKYKPKPVREILLEMKNLSGLMMDLAYSAALFNDKDLAEEVLELEKKVDTLAYLLDMIIMIAARDAEDAEALAGVAKVAGATDKISDAAADIAMIVKQEIGIHPIMTEIFEKVEEHIARAIVDEKSVMVGKKIGKLNLTGRIGVDIIAIRRGGDWIVNPSNNEKILFGDILIARGTRLGISKFREIAEGKIRRIVGVKEDAAGSQERFKEIVEKFVELKDTSELMIDLAYSALLLNSRELAESVHRLEEYVDKLHIEYEMTVLLSRFKEEEAKGILGLIRLGVVTEEIADAAAEIAETVLRGIEPHPVMKLVIEEADETVTYANVSENSPLVKKKLQEARIPEETGMRVLAIKRGDKYIRPRPDLEINAGDIIIAFGYAEGEENLKKLASSSQFEKSDQAEGPIS
jgi:uncharacterized protein with PhoU and TrkA domain